MQRINFTLNNIDYSGLCIYLNSTNGYTSYQFLSPVEGLQHGLIVRSDRDRFYTTGDNCFELDNLSFR